MPDAMLVSDFDGTIAANDFYKLALQQLLPAELPPFWQEYRSGSLTHFEALREMFAALQGSEADVLTVVRQMRVDPELPTTLKRLRQSGWDVVITSAGCRWYIDKLLAEAGAEIEVHANPGRFVPGRGLVMELPTSSPFFCHELGVDKAAVVRHWQSKVPRVAFAGDGYADFEAARLVPAEDRFARADLAASLREAGLEYRPFTIWSEIADDLLTRGAA